MKNSLPVECWTDKKKKHKLFFTRVDHEMFQHVTICDMHKNEYDIYIYNVYTRMTDRE